MAHDNEIIAKASTYISQLFKEKLPDWAVYHNFDHTESVVQYWFY